MEQNGEKKGRIFRLLGQQKERSYGDEDEDDDDDDDDDDNGEDEEEADMGNRSTAKKWREKKKKGKNRKKGRRKERGDRLVPRVSVMICRHGSFLHFLSSYKF